MGVAMRRMGMAVMGAGLIVAASAAASFGPVARVSSGSGSAAGEEAAAKTVTGIKAISYAGYVIQVPAGWPVYRLDADPHSCVRYDVHAIYLGTPGRDQQCPAHLVGRTEAVRIRIRAAGRATAQRRGDAAHGAAQRGAHGAAQRGAHGAAQRGAHGAAQSGAHGAAQSGAQSVAPGRTSQRALITRDRAGHEIRLTVRAAAGSRRIAGSPPRGPAGSAWVARPRPGLSVTATYGDNRPLAERIITSVRAAAASADRETSSVSRTSVRAGGTPSAAQPRATRFRSTAGLAPRVVSERPRGILGHGPIAGFDTCTAPSVRAMQAWRSAYSAVGIYIGGLNRSCDQANLSARWVSRVRAMGWSFLPTYVGLQAPCDRFSAKIDGDRAGAQARGAANSAVRHALALGIRRGAPIYFDMEAYDNTKRKCRAAVLTFLDAWTRQLHARHFVSGVYSSAGSGVVDLGGTNSIAGHALAKPDSIWFALWDGHADLRGAPYLLASWWPGERRIKQFRGGRWQEHGGFRLNIDLDQVFGP